MPHGKTHVTTHHLMHYVTRCVRRLLLYLCLWHRCITRLQTGRRWAVWWWCRCSTTQKQPGYV